MTAKEKAETYRGLAADRAKLAAKYARTKDYERAARWYNAADIFMRIATEFAHPRRKRAQHH